MLVTTENTLDKIGNAVRDRLNTLPLHTVVFKNKIPSYIWAFKQNEVAEGISDGTNGISLP